MPLVEWLCQIGVAIAAAAGGVPWDDAVLSMQPWVELRVGSASRRPPMRPLVTCEGISFRTGHKATIDRMEESLVHVGASRKLMVTRDDPVARERLAPFGFLHAGALLRFNWWGANNERSLRSVTGLPAYCTRGDNEDAWLTSAFDVPERDAGAIISAFHAIARGRATDV
jgi:hypothetical protein